MSCRPRCWSTGSVLSAAPEPWRALRERAPDAPIALLARRRRPRFLVALVIAVALALTGTSIGLAVLVRHAPPVLTHSTFVDNFNGPAGASPNYGFAHRVWYSDPCWRTGCGGDTPTRYSSANAYLDGHGHLVLVARRGAHGTCGTGPCLYTSARLTMVRWSGPSYGSTSFSQQYGTFSARIKLPTGKGFWPAFWLVGSNIARVGWPRSGEIDVLEAYHGPHLVEQHVAFGRAGRVHRYGSGWPLPAGQSLSGWHTYTVVWSPSGITWEVDGQTTLSLSAAQVGPDWASEFEHPFSLILDLAVGGLAGMPSRSAHWPAKMLVAWVRVTQTGH